MPADSRMARYGSLDEGQVALAWALRDERMTSLVIGASSVPQLEQNVAALSQLEISVDELAEIDRYAGKAGADLRSAASED